MRWRLGGVLCIVVVTSGCRCGPVVEREADGDTPDQPAVAPPRIDAIGPSSGHYGVTITATGENLDGPVQVRFTDRPDASIAFSSSDAGSLGFRFPFPERGRF